MLDRKNSPYVLKELTEEYNLNELIQPPLESARVRFRNLAVENKELLNKLLTSIEHVLVNGQLIMGKEVHDLEQKIADYCGVRGCIGVSSGTSENYLALAAYGIGKNDEIITTSMSALGTANAIAATGATPVFVDVGEDLNINPDSIENAITSRTKGILPVHYTGRLCDMDKIMKIASKHKLFVLEDASQAWGATNHLGKAGSLADAAAISISQMKILNSYGEAGVVLTDNSDLAEKVRSLRYLGTINRELCLQSSLNHKIDTIQAAMAMTSFEYVNEHISRRLEIATRYHNGLSNLVSCPEPPGSINDKKCVFFDYTIKSRYRSKLRKWMEKFGIEVKIRHPLTFPDQPCFRNLSNPEIPVARRLANEILSLPIHEKLADKEIDYVIDCIHKFYDDSVNSNG